MTREQFESVLFAAVKDEATQDALNEYPLQLEAECAKLRELVADMWRFIRIEHPRGGYPDMGVFERRMVELGIEVAE